MTDKQKLTLIEYLFDPNVQEIGEIHYTPYFNENVVHDEGVLLIRYIDNGLNRYSIGITRAGTIRTYA